MIHRLLVTMAAPTAKDTKYCIPVVPFGTYLNGTIIDPPQQPLKTAAIMPAVNRVHRHPNKVV